jgi:hypothetical protein
MSSHWTLKQAVYTLEMKWPYSTATSVKHGKVALYFYTNKESGFGSVWDFVDVMMNLQVPLNPPLTTQMIISRFAPLIIILFIRTHTHGGVNSKLDNLK